ncbi:MAG: hypothetical protein ACI9R3_004758 [Verrucomicrobiales bacterium]|jgi:hypothetical protein
MIKQTETPDAYGKAKAMKKHCKILSFITGVLLLTPMAATAAPIPGLFNTGVDADGNLLPGDGAVDPHYELIDSGDERFPGPDAVTLAAGFPVGPWIAEGPDSRWIAPQAASANGEPGTYTYRTTFDLTGFDSESARITGELSGDDNAIDVIINGFSTGQTGVGFSGFAPFTIDTDFVEGVNEIEFIVSNGGEAENPTGLRVKLIGTVEVAGEVPSILTQPLDQNVLLGEPFTLKVVADGEAPLAFQWQQDGVDLPGETADTLEIFSSVASNAGEYTMVVSNANGTATSDPARVLILEEVPGLMFNTGVDDDGELLFDDDIDPHYQIAVNPDSESPDAVVQNTVGFPIGDGPWLAPGPDSNWIGPTFNTNGEPGDYTFRTTLDLSGFDPTTAFVEGQWSTDNSGVDIVVNGISTGETGPGFNTYGAFNISPGNFTSGTNTIDFIVNNAGNTPNPIGLRIDAIRLAAAPGGVAGTPTIVSQPESQAVKVTASATLLVLADGTQPLTYQWRFQGADLGGAVGNELTLFNFGEANVGDYDVIVTNELGNITSDTATLTILPQPPVITMQPQDLTGVIGEEVTISVVVDGLQPMTFLWRRNGEEFGGPNSPDLVLPNVGVDDAADYEVMITNTDGETTTEVATLTLGSLVPGVFSTGVDDNGEQLFELDVDPHYQLTVNADSESSDALVMTGIPSPPWVEQGPDSEFPDSQWIGPIDNTNGAEGDYIYRMSFDLTGFDPATVVLTGSWATDNTGPDMLLNGVSTGLSNAGNFDSFTPFTINSGFVDGGNVLEFVVNNAGNAANPTGLRIDNLRAVGTAVDVPIFQVTEVEYDSDLKTVKLTWNSVKDASYSIFFSTNLVSFEELTDGVTSEGSFTSFTDDTLPGNNSFLYYQVRLDQ